MKAAYDYVVVGCGGLGSAAAYRLAREAGSEVLVLEQFRLGHDRGASDDHSRTIRLSQHDPVYMPLAPNAYTAWYEVEEESGVPLLLKTGILHLSDADSRELADFREPTRAAFPIEDLTGDEIMERWPQWRLDDNQAGFYQADGGIVNARKANAVHATLARAHGATILEETRVRRVRPDGDGVAVETSAGTFTAGRLVVAADAWTNQVLAGVGVDWPLLALQEQVTYFATPNLREFAPDRFPPWIWHRDAAGDGFYGIPVYGEVATKAAGSDDTTVVTGDDRTFEPNPRTLARLTRFLERRLPGSLGPVLYTKTCLVVMPPDLHFILTPLPEYPQIIVAQGASHGFKFAALIGQILADLAIRGETPYPIAAFATARPGLTDPGFPPLIARPERDEPELATAQAGS